MGDSPSTQHDGTDAIDIEHIIGENGGDGEWDTGLVLDEPIERWYFPRFPGADKQGTCSATGKAHQGVHQQRAACRDFTPDPGVNYLSRAGISGHDSDVETLVAWLEAPREIVGAIMLLGEPGTGKTALVEAAVTHAERPLTTVVCTPDHTKDSLFLRFVGEGNGEGGTPFALGPIPYAVKHGHTLYMDEFMLLVDGVKPLIYPLADGRRYLPEGNVDGSPLEVHPDFRLIFSSNPMVRGASLPEPVASRCAGTTLTVETSADMLVALGIDESIIAAWQALGNAGLWQPQIREMKVADYWMRQPDASMEQVVSALVPEHVPETQRHAVRETLVSHLGGDVREDGRLVVS